MSNRVKELAERERLLQARCAAQRAGIAHDVALLEAKLGSIDRIAGMTRNALLHPAVVAGYAPAVGGTRHMAVDAAGLQPFHPRVELRIHV